MSREKQIEEMRKTFEDYDKEFFQFCSSHESCLDCPYCNEGKNFYKMDVCYLLRLPEALVDKGYRKASEVAREIFEEIEEGVKAAISALAFENNPIHRQVKHETYSSLMRFVKTVEKKYIGEDTKHETYSNLMRFVKTVEKKYIGEDTNVRTNMEGE